MLDIRYEGDSAEIEASGSDIDGVHPAAVEDRCCTGALNGAFAIAGLARISLREAMAQS